MEQLEFTIQHKVNKFIKFLLYLLLIIFHLYNRLNARLDENVIINFKYCYKFSEK